jgi:hypothetical protein
VFRLKHCTTFGNLKTNGSIFSSALIRLRVGMFEGPPGGRTGGKQRITAIDRTLPSKARERPPGRAAGAISGARERAGHQSVSAFKKC